MHLILATNNIHKIDEIRAMLMASGIDACVETPPQGMPAVDENAPDFQGNAHLKLKAIQAQLPEDAYALADDSGLSVDALDGAPGVRSARYAGEHASDQDNNEKLLNALTSLPTHQRSASFVCHLALLCPDGIIRDFVGTCKGQIQEQASGHEGFGYDPLFIPEGYTQSFAQLGANVKNRLSHRAKAIKTLVSYLKSA